MAAAVNRETPNASHATGIHSTQFCQFVYGKPGALFSVNRLSDAEAQATGSLRLSHRPSDGLENQIQLICGAPIGWGRHGNRYQLCLTLKRGPNNRCPYRKKGSAPDTVLQCYHSMSPWSM